METLYNILSYGGLILAILFAVAAVIIFIKMKIPKAIGDLTGRTARKQIEEIREKGYEGMQGGGVSKKDAIKDRDSTGRIAVRDVEASEKSVKQKGTIEKVMPSKDVQERSQARYKQAIEEIKSDKSSANSDSPEEATDVLGMENDYEGATDVLGAENDYEDTTDVLSMDEDYEGTTDVLSMDEDYEGTTDVLSMDEDYEGTTDVLSMDEDYEGATDVLSGGDSYEDSADVSNQTYNDLGGEDVVFSPETGFIKIYDVVVVNTEESIRRE